MTDEKQDWPWTGLFLSAIYLFLIWSLPCLDPNCGKAQYQGETQSQVTKIVTLCGEAACTTTKEYSEPRENNSCYAGPACATLSFTKIHLRKMQDDPIALFTGLLFISTLGLWISTHMLGKAGERQIGFIEKQHGLAREEYFASHRPKITIRRMGTVPVSRQPTTVYFTMVNTGETTATECKWNGMILMLESIGAIHTVIGFNSETIASHVEPLRVGEGITRGLLDTVTFDPAELIDLENRAKILHVLGYVAYTDTLGVTRRTGFFRYFDVKRQRFRVVDDPEYEYQD